MTPRFWLLLVDVKAIVDDDSCSRVNAVVKERKSMVVQVRLSSLVGGKFAVDCWG